MSKSKINAVLKQFGFGFIKLEISNFDSITYTNWEGKRVRGVKIVTHSPMDCFPKDEQISKKLTQIRKELELAGFEIRSDMTVVVSKTKKRMTIMHLDLERMPTYSRRAGLDAGYTTTYMVPRYTTEDI